MDLTFNRDDAVNLTARIAGIVKRGNSIPILANCLVEAGGDQLRLTATNQDTWAVARIPSEVREEGKSTFPADMFANLIRGFPAGSEVRLIIADDDPRAVLKCGRSTYRLPILRADDFPLLEAAGFSTPVAVPDADLDRLFENTSFAVHASETKPGLMGVYLAQIGNRLRAVATDTASLALSECAAPAGLDIGKGILIPPTLIAAIKGAMGTGGVNISWRPGFLRAAGGGLEVTGKLFSAEFPAGTYERVIPPDSETPIRIDATDLLAALRRIVPVVDEEKEFPVRLDLAPGQVTITGKRSTSAAAEEVLEIDYDGEPRSPGYSAKRFLKIVDQLKGETVEIHYQAVSPGGAVSGAARIVDPNNPNAVYVLCALKGTA